MSFFSFLSSSKKEEYIPIPELKEILKQNVSYDRERQLFTDDSVKAAVASLEQEDKTPNGDLRGTRLSLYFSKMHMDNPNKANTMHRLIQHVMKHNSDTSDKVKPIKDKSVGKSVRLSVRKSVQPSVRQSLQGSKKGVSVRKKTKGIKGGNSTLVKRKTMRKK